MAKPEGSGLRSEWEVSKQTLPMDVTIKGTGEGKRDQSGWDSV
jgi:hypothetical protein